MEKFSKSFIVSQKDTAKVIGSGDLDVLATPVLIRMVENTAKDFLAKELTPDETTVGTMISAKHSRPSKVGAEIFVHIKIETREKSKVDFSFEVLDNEQVVASGTHQRAVILTDVFLSKLALSK